MNHGTPEACTGHDVSSAMMSADTEASALTNLTFLQLPHLMLKLHLLASNAIAQLVVV